MNYKQAGVDIQAGEDLVAWLKHSSKTPAHLEEKQKRLVGGIGGFASLFQAGWPEMEAPALVSCTDGVGTKLLLASHFQEFESVGQDLVAMCVNDLICTGGEPLFFLDYYACGQLDLEAAKAFLLGVRGACEKSHCLLIGGETAEMPGVYEGNHFDCAGFSVGVVDQPKAFGPHKVQEGDQLVAVASHGFHSNGYSLLRKVFADDLGDWKDVLLRPTALYVDLVKQAKSKDIEIHAVAHITGGGLDNVGRVLPEKLQASLEPWSVPKEFLEVQRRGALSPKELLTTLNCGLGLVLALPQSQVSPFISLAESLGEKSFQLGQVVARPEGEAPWSLDFEFLMEAQ